MSDTAFDLGTNAKVPISAIDTDASGTLVPGATAVYASSDEAVLTLTDQADGSTIAVRVAAGSGSAIVSATVTNPDGTKATGTLAVSLADIAPVVADVTNVELVPGSPS